MAHYRVDGTESGSLHINDKRIVTVNPGYLSATTNDRFILAMIQRLSENQTNMFDKLNAKMDDLIIKIRNIETKLECIEFEAQYYPGTGSKYVEANKSFDRNKM
jgi:hypothetical protein